MKEQQWRKLNGQRIMQPISDEVKQAIEETILRLITVKITLDDINRDEQFDYVTDSKLGRLADELLRVASQVNRIINQGE